ncbi:MAG: adenylate/guanylate cyclase domain-containing protein [Pseudomonadota bacterium]
MSSIAAINEQLLRAIGVGIALARGADRKIFFQNLSFWTWFEEPELGRRLEETLTDVDPVALDAALAEGRTFAQELKIKRKRRTLIINLTISEAEDEQGRVLVIECQNVTRMRELETMIESYSSMVERNTRDLEREKERVEKLLLNIMPRQVYEEYKTFGVVTPQLFKPVSVLMLDFVGFVNRSREVEPNVLVGELNEIYTAFDRIAEQFGCERIKTVGDAYLAVAGMPEPSPDHARSVTATALRFVKYLERRNQGHRLEWRCRVGVASGSVVGSVVGVQKYVYDVFGEAVNLASRLQTLAEPMQVIAVDSMKADLADEFSLSDLGVRDVRGFGEQRLLRVNSDSRLAAAI